MTSRRVPAIVASTHSVLRRGFLGVCILISACSTQPLVGQYTPHKTECCATASEYGFQVAPLGKDVEFSFIEATSTLRIGERTSHMFGVRVPDGTAVTAALVRTYLSTEYLPKATAVAPELHFYDAQFKQVGAAAVDAMQSDKGFWRASISGRVAVPENVKYVVVVAGKRSGGVIHAPNGRSYVPPPAALGDMSIRLFGGKPGE